MIDKKFCKKCGIKLDEGMMGFGKTPMYEFSDGWYCEKCAKSKVEKARK